MPKNAVKYAIWAAAAFAVFYVAKRASAGGPNPDMGGQDFGTNGSFSQDTWEDNDDDWG